MDFFSTFIDEALFIIVKNSYFNDIDDIRVQKTTCFIKNIILVYIVVVMSNKYI